MSPYSTPSAGDETLSKTEPSGAYGLEKESNDEMKARVSTAVINAALEK